VQLLVSFVCHMCTRSNWAFLFFLNCTHEFFLLCLIQIAPILVYSSLIQAKFFIFSIHHLRFYVLSSLKRSIGVCFRVWRVEFVFGASSFLVKPASEFARALLHACGARSIVVHCNFRRNSCLFDALSCDNGACRYAARNTLPCQRRFLLAARIVLVVGRAASSVWRVHSEARRTIRLKSLSIL
jgi:hypothetical protein